MYATIAGALSTRAVWANKEATPMSIAITYALVLFFANDLHVDIILIYYLLFDS